MPASTLIRNAAWTAEWDGATGRNFYGQGKDVLLADGRIAAITPHDPSAPPPAGAEVIDGSKLLVMPGLINIHTHPTTEPAGRGVREDHGVPEQQMTGLFERLQAFKLDQQGQAAAMRLAYAELMSAGVTSVVDLSPPFPILAFHHGGKRPARLGGGGLCRGALGYGSTAVRDLDVEPRRCTPAIRCGEAIHEGSRSRSFGPADRHCLPRTN